MQKRIRFSHSEVVYYLDYKFSRLNEIADKRNTIILTDENVFRAHSRHFSKWKTIVLKPGEEFKVQATVDSVVDQLIGMQADRKTCLVGVGGGVITDLTGFIASIFMRGIRFGFVPTSLLALVDASIGGKNGIDVGQYKNMVGVIRQPGFILHDNGFLSSLPQDEWRNGFAEIIKHACITDSAMFRELEKNDIIYYSKKKKELGKLISRNMMLKTKVVKADEFEQGERKKLNFGHTLGHALETQYELSHGQAISIGMAYAAALSEEIMNFKDRNKIVRLLGQYGLPSDFSFDKDKVFEVLKKDKKRTKDMIDFILLQKIGRAVIKTLPVEKIYTAL